MQTFKFKEALFQIDLIDTKHSFTNNNKNTKTEKKL